MVSSGVDSNKNVHPILVDGSGRPYVRLSDGITAASIDAATGGLIVSRALHRRVEQSNQWIASYLKTELAGDGNFYFHLKVGSDLNAHMNYCICTEAKAHIWLYEDPTTATDGTAVPGYNLNRETGTSATMLVYRDPSSDPLGDILEYGMVGTTGFFTTAGGTADKGGYWLLKKNEQYLIRVRNEDAAAKDVVVIVTWHEE